MTDPATSPGRILPADFQVCRKLKWSAEEDELLISAVETFGMASWGLVASKIPGRSGKQCRERWLGQLSPLIVKSNWTVEEDSQLLWVHAFHGNHWCTIARFLPGRDPIAIKNRWNSLARRSMPAFLPVQYPLWQVDIHHNDVMKQPLKLRQMSLDPLVDQEGLFGAPFREFQAKMLAEPV
jgi:hypothetical protein